jgi:hypothetical protein
MKKLTLERLVPIIPASVPWLILAITDFGLLSLPKWDSSRKHPHQPLFLELKSWSTRFSSTFLKHTRHI